MSKKNYGATLDRWSSVVLTISSPGAPPEEPISGLVQLQPLLRAVPRSGEERHKILGVRAGVLHEALYLLHKAWHVGYLCTEHIESGRFTWAEVDAYQSSLFALGAVLGLFGISFPSPNAFIDVWPERLDGNSKLSRGGVDEEIQLLGFQSLDHYVKWSILKRVLRTCESGSLANQISLAIDGIADRDFAARRNGVHYQPSTWLHTDLFAPMSDQKFGRSSSMNDLLESLRQRDQNFSIALMLALLHLSYSMASHVGVISGTVAAELKLVEPYTKAVSKLWAECCASEPKAA